MEYKIQSNVRPSLKFFKIGPWYVEIAARLSLRPGMSGLGYLDLNTPPCHAFGAAFRNANLFCTPLGAVSLFLYLHGGPFDTLLDCLVYDRNSDRWLLLHGCSILHEDTTKVLKNCTPNYFKISLFSLLNKIKRKIIDLSIQEF